MDTQTLRFSPGNAKIKHIPNFNLPAGFACPFAEKCFTKADKVTGKLTDGKKQEFRCFAASAENLFKNVREQRWNNFDILRKLKTPEEIAAKFQEVLPKNVKYIRIHASGDFYSQIYFDGILQLSNNNPDIIFYTYTKSIPYWIARIGQIPSNLRLTASIGGKHDNLIKEYNLKYAQVVYSEQEAKDLGLEIDHDDSHGFGASDKPFALLIHGVQPAGSKASKAKQQLVKEGWTGYSREGGYSGKKKTALKQAA
jgi:hypothetical protein